MASTKNMQQEAFSAIDTAKALVDKVLSIMEIILVSPSLSLTFSINPIGFLLQLLDHLGVTKEQLKAWLISFLIYVVPILEIAVKTILLTNLKNMISCSIDPRIPEKYRKQHKSPSNPNTSQEHGIDINIESIDYLDKLSMSPLGDRGSELYFGLEGVDDVYKFARAFDFDAFLWFVMHKGKFPMSSDVDSSSNEKIRGLNLLSASTITASADDPTSILMGNTFKYTSGHVISMCIDRKFDAEYNIVENTIVPVSDDWNSVNWYANKSAYFTSNLGFGTQTNIGRDYTKERALCNLQFIDQASSDAPITGLVNNKLRFTILPKPYIHIPDIGQGEPPWRFKKMLFDAEGYYDSNGKYTIICTGDVANESIVTMNYGGNGQIQMDINSGIVTVTDREDLKKHLIECYPGLTVFEFNYDYVMSLKLFDAKVMATTLLDSLLNTRVGISLGVGTKHQEGTETIKEIIKNIIETDDSTVNDCYFTFDNSKYDALMRKSEQKRARQEAFGDTTHKVGSFDKVNEILNEYDSNAELNVQMDVLHRAITQASVTITEGVEEKDKSSIEFNFIHDLIENLVMAIVNGILSPKVLLLLEVNQTLMGGTWEKFTLEDLLKAMRVIIVAIVKEVRDMIIQELLKFVLKILEPIIALLSSILLREQLEAYADAILEIIRNCPFIWFKFSSKKQDTKLDIVDYADIDASSSESGEKPENNC